MLTLAVARVVERQVLEQFDVGRQTHAGVRALNQVVTEQGLRRKAIRQNAAERVHVVDRLAVKDGFSEQILLGVGNGLAVRIGARGVGEDAREPRGRCARQARC